jgi:phosphohistidine phosphatase SixA
MRLILVRHGTRDRVENDPVDPLSALGRAQVGKLADALSARSVAITRCFSSDRLHATQTAQILLDRLAGGGAIDVVKVQSLIPHAGAATLGEFLQLAGATTFGGGEDILVVAHKPRVDDFLLATTYATTKAKCAELAPGEGACVVAASIAELRAGEAALEWRGP